MAICSLIEYLPKNFLFQLLINDVLLTEILHDPVHEVGQVLDGDVEEEGAGLDAESEVDQRVEGEGGDVRLAPLPSLGLEVLLVLDPSKHMHQSNNSQQLHFTCAARQSRNSNKV